MKLGRTAKAGDLAAIINLIGYPKLNGQLCQVLSDPITACFTRVQPPTGAFLRSPFTVATANKCRLRDGRIVCIETQCLLPIPPDDQARKLFDERELPRGAVA